VEQLRRSDRVIWVPFSDHPLLEILGNVALFFPFGYSFLRANHRHLCEPPRRNFWLITSTE
jgi:glycopeptide antibiotics resistance protein